MHSFAVISIFLTKKRQNTLPEQDLQPKVTKLKPGRERKTLRYDYKKPIPPSKVISRATPFSKLKHPDRYKTVEDFIDAQEFKREQTQRFWLERKQGSESEQARQEAFEQAAGKVSLAPILQEAPRVCSQCRELIPGDKPRTHLVHVNQPAVGVEVTSVELQATLCEACTGKEPEPSQPSLAAEGWTEMLRDKERTVYQLTKKGLTQEEIAPRIGQSQQTVSRILKRIAGKEKAWREERYRKTRAGHE